MQVGDWFVNARARKWAKKWKSAIDDLEEDLRFSSSLELPEGVELETVLEEEPEELLLLPAASSSAVRVCVRVSVRVRVRALMRVWV